MNTMKKEDCIWKTDWDYSRYKRYHSMFISQKDWNNTLMTKINQISAQIYKFSLRGGASVIELHPKFLPLFNSLEYYNSLDKLLSNRYVVIFNKNIDANSIFVYRIHDGTMYDPIDPNLECGSITFKSENEYSQEEVIKYKKGLSGCIEVLNYRQFDGIKIFSQRTKT